MATYVGSLVQLCCLEGGILQTNVAVMCGVCSQCMEYIAFAPAQGSVCFPCLHCSGSRMLFRGTFQSGSCFCALPRSKPLRFSGTPQGHRCGWACIFSLRRSKQLRQQGAWQAHCPRWAAGLNHLPGPSHSVSSQVCHVSPLGS